MSTIKSESEDLTLNAHGSGNDILFQSNGSQVGSLTAEGVMTATSFAGSGANLTGIATPITALNNATADELVTVGSTTTELDAESGLTFNGTVLHTNAGTSGASTHSATRIRIEDDTHCGIEITTPNTSEQYIMFSDPQGQAGEIKYAHSSNLMNFQSNGSFAFKKSATTHMNIDTDGAMTKPLQPCFSVNLSAEHSNISAGAYTTVPFNNEIYDVGSNFTTSSPYTFTAPVTGKYFISLHFKMEEIQNGASYIRFLLTTSNRGYSAQIDPRVFDADGDYWSVYITHLCDMDANDTAYARLKQIGGDSHMDLGTETMMTGILLA